MGFLTPKAEGELAVLATYALQQLAQLRTSVHGLTDEQARSTPSASALNLTGLLLHAGEVAVYWSSAAASAPDGPALPEGIDEDHALEELVADERPLAAVLERFDRCVEAAAERMAAVTDLAAPVPVPDAPWFPKELGSWEARWCLAHIIAEVARHAGHADLIRETIDGKGSYELNDLADAEIEAEPEADR